MKFPRNLTRNAVFNSNVLSQRNAYSLNIFTVLHDTPKASENAHSTIPWESGCSATTFSTLLVTGLLAKSTSSMAMLGRLGATVSAFWTVVRFFSSEIYI